jgi:hypothetical protein
MEEELMEILERRRSLLAVEGMKDDEREKWNWINQKLK